MLKKMTVSRRLFICFFAFSLYISSVKATVASSDNSGATAGKEKTDTRYKPGVGRTEKPLSILMLSTPTPGHLFTTATLGGELVKRGYNVTLCATVMEGSNLLPDLPESYGINFVSAGSGNLTQTAYESVVREFQTRSLSNMQHLIARAFGPLIQLRTKIDEIGVEQFDIIISDILVSVVGVYYSRLGRKSMVLSPVFNNIDATTPEWPSPVVLTGLSENLTYFQRIFNSMIYTLLRSIRMYMSHQLVRLDEKYRQVLKPTDFTSYVGIQMPLVVTSMFGLDYPKTCFPLTHYVGPLMMDSFTPLEEQLVEWLSNKPNKTVIYVGMGATGFITSHMAQLIIDGILATDFSVVWALPMSDQAVLEGIDIDKERFYISKWVPRQTLFKQPTLAMTILHCGMNSVQESLYNGLPVVCVPHAFDHFDVASRIDSAKVGIPLYTKSDSFRQGNALSSENVKNAIKNITETKEYSERAQKMRKVFMFAGGVKRAADLVEFYSEVGYDHLIPAYAKYEWSWIQYYNVDVYCVLSLLGCLLFYFFYRLLKCCCKCFRSKAKKRKSD